jgi:hypothetical protein
MRPGLHCTGWLLVLVLALASESQAAKPKPATPQDYTQLSAHTTLLGTLVRINSDRSLVLQVEYQYYRAPGSSRKGSTRNSEDAQLKALSREQQKILKEQEKLLRLSNPVKRMQELQRFVARQQKQSGHTGSIPHGSGRGPSLRLVKGTKTYVLQASDGIKVRTMEPTPALDARGNPRALTDAEKKVRKGPEPELPGYHARWGTLKAGDTVRVYFSENKAPAKNAAAKAGAKEGKDDAEEPNVQVSMIVLLDDGGEPPTAKKKK